MFELPQLPYSKNALEPYISEKTLSYHYDKHHNGYVANLNKLIENTDFIRMSLEDIILSTYQQIDKIGIFNNAAQAWNHTFYWQSMKKNGGGKCSDFLNKQIIKDFGSFENFIEKLKNSATTQFGSGWAWVVWNKGNQGGRLEIVKTGNADNPMNVGLIPLLVIDIWEHAYYLDYQNQRLSYIEVFIKHLANWDFLEENLKKASK